MTSHIEDYLLHLRHRNRTERPVNAVESHLRQLSEEGECARLSDLTHDAVEQHLEQLKGMKRSARTLNWPRGKLSVFLNWAVKVGRLRENPLRFIPRQNEIQDRRQVRRALAACELQSLFDVANSAGRLPFNAVACYAGLRRSEIGRLRWDTSTSSKALLQWQKARPRSGLT